jgi:hypothetical protein
MGRADYVREVGIRVMRCTHPKFHALFSVLPLTFKNLPIDSMAFVPNRQLEGAENAGWL